MIDAVSLDLDPVVAEAASEEVGATDVILMRDKKLETSLLRGCRWACQKAVILKSTLDANDHWDHLQVWSSAERGEKFAEQVQEGGLPLSATGARKDVRCGLDGLEAGRA